MDVLEEGDVDLTESINSLFQISIFWNTLNPVSTNEDSKVGRILTLRQLRNLIRSDLAQSLFGSLNT